MTSCPCCAHLLLRHIRHQQVYWFCRQCWQEMPVLEQSCIPVSTFLERQYALPPLTCALVSANFTSITLVLNKLAHDKKTLMRINGNMPNNEFEAYSHSQFAKKI